MTVKPEPLDSRYGKPEACLFRPDPDMVSNHLIHPRFPETVGNHSAGWASRGIRRA